MVSMDMDAPLAEKERKRKAKDATQRNNLLFFAWNILPPTLHRNSALLRPDISSSSTLHSFLQKIPEFASFNPVKHPESNALRPFALIIKRNQPRS